MNIYISSSWKNRERVRALAIALHEAAALSYIDSVGVEEVVRVMRSTTSLIQLAAKRQRSHLRLFPSNSTPTSTSMATIYRRCSIGAKLSMAIWKRCDVATYACCYCPAVQIATQIGAPASGHPRTCGQRSCLSTKGSNNIAKQNQALRECVTYARSKRGKDFDFDTWAAMCDAAMAGAQAPSALENEIALHAQTRDALIAVRKERDALLVDTCHGASCGKCLLCRVRSIHGCPARPNAKLKQP